MKSCLLTLITLSLLLFPSLGEAASKQENLRVVVLPFQVNAGNPTALALGKKLPDMFISSLIARGFKVVPQKESLALMKKLKITQLSQGGARSIGQQAKADLVIYGTFTELNDSFSLDTRMVDVKTSQTKPYFVEKKSTVELGPAVADLVSNLSSTAKDSITGGIADVQIRGLKVLDPEVILMRLNTRKGDVIDPQTLNDQIKRIWDLGYFSDVSANLEPSPEGLLLVFTVAEKPKIIDIVINGSDAVKKEDILAAMSSKTGSVINDRFLAGDIQKITELYRKEGYYLAQVDYRIEHKENTASALLVFDVKEGKKLYIKQVKISGLEQLSESDVLSDLALQNRTLISLVTGTGVLREEYLERDSAAVATHGMNKGFADIQVSAPEVIYEDDGIIVNFKVNEGKRFKLGNISFKGDLIETDDRLFEIIELDEHKKDVEYFSLNSLQNDVKALTDFYSNYGYAFAEIDVQSNKDNDAGTIDIMYTVQKNSKINIRRVITDGNIRTRDNVILRELRMADGDTFDGSLLRRSNERLNRLQYFTQVDTTLLPTENPDEVDLRVNIKEDRTGALMGGVGYSTYYKVGVTASVMERNLFGRGYFLGLQGFLSSKATNVDLSFTNPRIYDTDLGFSNDVYARWEQWDDFTKRTVGDTIRFFHPIGEYTSVSAGYRLDRYSLVDIPITASRAYKDYEGNNLSSVVSLGVVYDSTNDTQRPSKGHIAKVFTEYGGGGIGGNDNYFKPILELQGFYALSRSNNHIFHWRGRLGAAIENSDKPVPVFDRFFIGGMDSIRGYSMDDLAPRDPMFPQDQIGGDRMGFVNLEYIWTFQEELGLAMVPFFDIGFQNDSAQSSTFSNLKKSVGLELRWRSPMGDLRFAYGVPLDKNIKGDKTKGRFEFSMGQFF